MAAVSSSHAVLRQAIQHNFNEIFIKVGREAINKLKPGGELAIDQMPEDACIQQISAFLTEGIRSSVIQAVEAVCTSRDAVYTQKKETLAKDQEILQKLQALPPSLELTAMNVKVKKQMDDLKELEKEAVVLLEWLSDDAFYKQFIEQGVALGVSQLTAT